ncbi:MAG: zinc-binding protein [Chthonomonadales bacterium]|nr:zinc-binding protein [Chthonomonadales bacterium]
MSECCASNDTTLLFACSGGSNVGQIANDAAKALDQLGQGRMYCAVGVAARLPSFVETAAKADKRVLIDGCEVQCLKKAFDGAGVPYDVHVIVTELGIAKGHHFNHTQDEVATVAGAVSKKLGVTPCCSGS